ncbi:MAG: hypothetical protein J7501_06015 [Bdellovibrio sp.]|nr:hypothetical protein [Bdellovibrio sp.]
MNKKVIISVSSLVIIGVAGAGYFLSRKKGHQPGQAQVSTDGFQALEELKKAQGVTLNTNLNSPAGKAWKAKDFAGLKDLFGMSKKVKQNHAFFQASIFVLDVTKPDWTAAEREQLHTVQDSIVEYMIAPREKPVLGEEAQVLSYASKVLLKFDSMSPTAVQKMLSYYASAKTGNQKDIIGETLIRLNPIPEKAKGIVRERLQSKTSPYDGVLLLGQMRDAQAAAQFWNEVYRGYAKYPDNVKPMIFKQMVINHRVIKGDLKKYLAEMAKKNEASGEDAFLIGVRELEALNEFRSEVQRLANQAQSADVKMLANSMLNSPVGTR